MSAALKATLQREFNPVPELLVDAINFALANGGDVELDYKRDFSASYNPRTARIVQIALQDGRVADPEILASLAIATSFNPRGAGVSRLTSKAEILFRFDNTDCPQDIPLKLCTSAAVLLLDRARRLHLAGKGESLKQRIKSKRRWLGDIESNIDVILDRALSR